MPTRVLCPPHGISFTVDSRTPMNEILQQVVTRVRQAGEGGIINRMEDGSVTIDEKDGVRTQTYNIRLVKADVRKCFGILALIHLAAFTQWCSYCKKTRRDRIVGFGKWSRELECNRVEIVREIAESVYGPKAPAYKSCEEAQQFCLHLQMNVLKMMSMLAADPAFTVQESREVERKIVIRRKALSELAERWNLDTSESETFFNTGPSQQEGESEGENRPEDHRSPHGKHQIIISDLFTDLAQRFCFESYQ